MFIVVAYDVVVDRRRTRLHRQLKGFGTAVQYSVFECLLDERQLKEMQTLVSKTIDRKQDSVRYYQLCETCRGKITAINGSADYRRDNGDCLSVSTPGKGASDVWFWQKHTLSASLFGRGPDQSVAESERRL